MGRLDGKVAFITGGLVMLMKVMAKGLAPQSIRVNTLHPITVGPT
jgi:NAD(P)-dependent dehydrogenase (short-subunit alcohol dehydrogenase family)